MRTHLLIFFLLASSISSVTLAQGGTWVWVNGSNATQTAAVYGTKGVPGTNNTPGGLYEGTNWIDQQGNFWIYGGIGPGYIELGDLWKYDPVANTWTWMNGTGVSGAAAVYGTQGVPAPSNTPGSRGWGVLSWTDNNNDFWLFGGRGFNDLWRYNIASNEWTWMNGSNVGGAVDVYGTLGVAAATNTPGDRNETTSGWVDATNNLWFFGGLGSSFTTYNDMWRYNVSTNQWTWMSGPQGPGNAGSYGIEGVTSATNVPPPRASYTHWQDAAGNFYIFGGWSNNNYSDVWKYDPVSSLWTWIAGDNVVNANGSYGSYCTDNGLTGPMSRYENRSAVMKGCTNVFLTFGGCQDVSYADANELNDLWLFDPQTTNWKWVSGTNTFGNVGSYGTLGLASTSNLPPARCGQAIWMDNTGVMWMYGGSLFNLYNDVWKFIPNSSCTQLPLIGGINYQLSQPLICDGDSTHLTISGASNVHITPTASVVWRDSAHATLFPTATTTYIITGNSSCRSNDTTLVTVNVTHPGILNYQLSTSTLCRGNSASLVLQGLAGAQIMPLTGVTWQDSSHLALTPDSTTTYRVTGQSTLCTGNDTGYITIHITQHGPERLALSDSVICSGNYAIVTLTGLTSATVLPAFSSYFFIDSSHIELDPYYTTQYVIHAQSSCGSPFVDSINLHVNSPGLLNYQLAKPALCLGDSTLLTVIGSTNITIVPVADIRAIDSTHYVLSPDSTTTYHIYGQSSCGGVDSATFIVSVSRPGVVTYTLANPYTCAGYSDYLAIYGMTNITITPYSYLYYIDSVDEYTYLSPYTTTTYTISGTSVCWGPVSSTVTVYVTPYPTYTLTNPYVCQGDTTSLTISGIYNPQITPNINVFWPDTSHIILRPDSTTTYTITGNTCNGPGSYQVTVYVVRPGIISYSLSSAGICPGGGSTTLTLYGVTSATITPASSFYWYGSTATAYLYPTGTTTYTVTGQSSCGGADSITFTVPVIPYANATLNQSSICQGGTSLLTITGLKNLQISPSSGVMWIDSSFDSSHVKLQPNVTTTYTITGYDCSGYYSYYYVTVNVLTPGVINYTLSDSNICSGNSAFLSIMGASNIQITPYSYLYYSDSVDATAYLYPAITTTYQLSGTSICGGTYTSDFTVHVSPSPAYTLSTSNICTGDSALLSFTGLTNAQISPISGLTWIDSTDAVLKPTVSTAYTLTGYSICSGYYYQYFYITVSTSGALTYTLDSNICSGSSAYLTVSGVTNPVITPYAAFTYGGPYYYYTYLYPTVNTTYMVTGQSVCGGNDTAIMNVQVSSSGSYTLSNSAICNGDSVEITLIGLTGIQFAPTAGVSWIDGTHAWLHPTATTQYSITGQSACSGTYFGSANITVSNLSVAASTSNPVICSADSTQICATAGFSSYQWNNGKTTPCIYVNQAGNYYVTVTDPSHCTAESNHIAVVVHAEPPVSISVNGDTFRVYNGLTPQWYLNGVAIPGATGYTYIAHSPGDYQVSVVDSNGCTTTSNKAQLLGIESVTADGVNIYPNPLSAGNWQLDVTNGIIGSEVAIYDDNGRLVYKSEVRYLHSEIDLDVARGVYLIRIYNAKSGVVKKLVKL